MKKQKEHRNEEILALTSFVIHNYYNRNLEAILPYFAPDFVWIGAWEFQYSVGRDSFLQTVDVESQADPAILSGEEYHLLTHEKNLWVVYGRYTASVLLEDGSLLTTKTRNTYVWKLMGEAPVLLHIHGSNAQDVPLTSGSPTPDSGRTYLEFLKSINQSWKNSDSVKKLSIIGTDHTQYYLYPDEISHISSDKFFRTIYLCGGGSFQTKMLLKDLETCLPTFLRIHRSWLVNQAQIASICRYQVTLKNGDYLPVGKERYLNLRERL